ncbi:JAB domain-containing protein [Fibrella aestuarina]|uniref:JAB domain-containing protein n=1 Tax=Fibrella aestuarina TaxID=651143 RepID=UPI00030989E1|nr:JAB domain-containing protein [Fibrella aestuarina]
MIPQTVTPVFSVGEIEVAYRATNDVNRPRPRITKSEVACDVLRHYWSGHMEWREEFYILLLNQANEVLAVYRVSEGGISYTCTDLRVIFQVALGVNATGVILAHNHPSGNLTPSQPDKDETRKIRDAGNLLNIKVLDHLILTSTTYLSFADDGLL